MSYKKDSNFISLLEETYSINEQLFETLGVFTTCCNTIIDDNTDNIDNIDNIVNNTVLPYDEDVLFIEHTLSQESLEPLNVLESLESLKVSEPLTILEPDDCEHILLSQELEIPLPSSFSNEYIYNRYNHLNNQLSTGNCIKKRNVSVSTTPNISTTPTISTMHKVRSTVENSPRMQTTVVNNNSVINDIYYVNEDWSGGCLLDKLATMWSIFWSGCLSLSESQELSELSRLTDLSVIDPKI
jgi:hypothetical protein